MASTFFWAVRVARGMLDDPEHANRFTPNLHACQLLREIDAAAVSPLGLLAMLGHGDVAQGALWLLTISNHRKYEMCDAVIGRVLRREGLVSWHTWGRTWNRLGQRYGTTKTKPDGGYPGRRCAEPPRDCDPVFDPEGPLAPWPRKEVAVGDRSLPVKNRIIRLLDITRMTPAALYRHYDKAGRLLYVGISLSPTYRLAQHRKSHWHGQIARVDIEWHLSQERAARAEVHAIRRERPLHNKVYNDHVET